MSIKWLKYNPITLVVIGVLLGVITAIPVCFAGGAVTIVRDKNLLAPRGSYIPERRVQKVLKKVREHKTMMKEKETMGVDKQLPETETAKPDSSGR